jgi:2-dehydro-3-deoxyphosphogluconate aldolase/(4S)-4-hydroxy-2-oxoglutarate aldolase
MSALQTILETGVIAIMRADSSEQLIAAADAIKAGGVRAIEVTMTTPDALGVIEQARARYGDEVLFGVGSVLDAETARAAILAGAQFVVCPTLKVATIELCKRYSVPVFPGALTPTEVLTAWEAGADVVKVFPSSFGGSKYIKALLAPLPQVRLCPVGGVSAENAADFIGAGAAALGVGSAIVNSKILASGDLGALTERARALIAAVKEGRGA